MHEASIVDSLLATAAEEASRAGQEGRITALTVTVGRLSGVNAQALRFAFEMLAPETRAAGAALTLEEPAAGLVCRACGAEAEVDDPFALCPVCQSAEVTITGGQELMLSALEVEELEEQQS